jgi:hypothetical protein
LIYFIVISDFFDTSAGLKNVFNAGVCGALSSDNRMVCFHRKAFLTSENVVGLMLCTPQGRGNATPKLQLNST